MTVLSLYLMTVCRDGDSPSPNLLSTYRRRKLDNNLINKISEVKNIVSCADRKDPQSVKLCIPDPICQAHAAGFGPALCPEQPSISLSVTDARLPAVHAICKLGLGLSPSRQTVIRHNDSAVIRLYVRLQCLHYAPASIYICI